MTTLQIEGRKVKVDDSFLSLSPAEQEATVEEIAASMNLSPKADGFFEDEGAMGQVNQGIASSIGGLVDLINPLDDFGITGSAKAGLENALDSAGIARATGDPQSMGQHFARGTGEAAGALLPVLGGARALQAGQGLVRGVGQKLTEPFTNTAVRATSAEMAAGGGARVGGELAVDASENRHPLVRMSGELGGGLVAATSPIALTRATGAAVKRTPVLGTAIRATQKAAAPFTDAGGRARASDRLRGLASDPEAAAQAIDPPGIGNLTPAQKTGDPNLMALERSVADENPAIRDQLAERAQDSAASLKDEYYAPAKGATVEDTRQFIEQKRTQFVDRLQERLETARRFAERRVAKTNPNRRETTNSVIARQEIDKAYDAAQTQERALWGRVPKSVKVPTQNVRSVFNEIVDTTPQAQTDDIPVDARRLLGEDMGFAASETVNEMHGLYSRLRQVAREAMSGPAPRENKARLANMMAEAILKDIGATVAPTTSAGQKLNEARAFSRAVNETYGQGAVARILGRQKTGGDAIPPEAALASTVGRQGAQGAVAVDQIRKAANTPEVDDAIDDFLRGRFTDRATTNGQLNPNRADSFTQANRDTLDRTPGLYEEIIGGAGATREFQAKEKRIASIVSALENPRKASTTALIRSTPGDEIATAIFKTQNPLKSVAEIKRQASRDPTGRAMDGLKSGVLDYLMKGAEGRFNAAGTRDISGNAMFGQLQDPKTRNVFKRVFDDREMSRLDRIAGEFQKLEAASKGKSLDAPIDDLPNSIIAFVARTFAARQGAKAGAGVSGASLLTAGFASKRMQNILKNLTNDKAEALIKDAITDPDLFKALLAPQRTDAIRKRTEKRLIEWLIGTAGVEFTDFMEPEQNQ